MNPVVKRSLTIIDAINEWVGKTMSFLVLIIMFSVVIEVVLRYFFNSPTIWATELNGMLLCGYAALAGGYAMVEKGHVSVEIVQERLRPKTRAAINLVTYLFGFAFLAILIWTSWYYAKEAWIYAERSESMFAPPLFPVKVAIPIGGVLFFIQLMAQFVREIMILKGENDSESNGTVTDNKGVKK